MLLLNLLTKAFGRTGFGGFGPAPAYGAWSLAARALAQLQPKERVGLGIRCNRFNRFGLLGFHKLRFAKFRNRTVLSKIRNRQLRSSVPRFGFSV